MNGAHFHLVINHLPIVGVIIGTLVLMAGILLKKDQVKLTGLSIYISSALTATFAFLTGEGAEEVVENIAGISEKLIHTHEEYGESFLTVSIILGLVSIVSFYLTSKNKAWSKILLYIVLLIGLSAVILGKLVGTSGGEIRHTEIRKSNQISNFENGVKDTADFD